jgi:hypothetical protein
MAASTHLVWLPRATSSSCSFVKRIEVYARVLPTVMKKKRTSVSQLRLISGGWEVFRGPNRLVKPTDAVLLAFHTYIYRMSLRRG